ncbi:SMI1/KNR4 family protein [Cupriavidus sp. DF5525]|uniref:SMI1/KNR4 family protein n=1 Tax=Cupriavidus sp. DF5525 TaxID=3160989 RepID=UPI0032DE9CA8
MKKQWEQLEIWLKANNSALFADLNPPATDADIQDLEQKLGVSLPAAYIDCLKVHMGQKGKAEWLFDGNEFLSIRHVLMSWSTWNDLLDEGDLDGRIARSDAEVQAAWWMKGWIPFASNGGGDYLCLDMSPSPQGRAGQVIEVFHDFPERRLLSLDFGDWFDNFVSRKLD